MTAAPDFPPTSGRRHPRQVPRRYLDLITSADFDDLAELYAPDAVLEHPFNPAGQRRRRNVFVLAIRDGSIVHSRDYQADAA